MVNFKTTMVGIIGFIFLAMVLLNYELINYREREILYNLDIISTNMKDVKTATLIARFNLIKNRIIRGEVVSDYFVESKIQGVLNSVFSAQGETAANDSIIKIITKLYLQAIRFFLGKNMPENIYSEYNNPYLELAFFYERYRKYEKAIEIMSNVANYNKDVSSFSWKFILLHTGFCNSMLSKHTQAKRSYHMVMQLYPASVEAETAKLLLGYTSVVENTTDSILKQNISKDEKAEKLYFLSDYKKSKKLYDEFLKNRTKKDSVYYKSKFYRGRSSEEIGYSDIAINDYKDIIKYFPHSSWANKSNVRLLVLGAFYNEKEELVEIAKKNSVKFQEKEIVNSLIEVKEKNQKDSFQHNKILQNYMESKEKKFLGKDSLQYLSVLKKNINVYKEKSKDFSGSIINLKNDNAINELSEIVEKKLVTVKSKYVGKEVNIKTYDGFTFAGKILHEDSSKFIIKTEFGKLPINKNTVMSINE